MPQAIETEAAQRLRITLGRLARLLRTTDAGLAADLTPTRVAVLLNAMRNGPVRLSIVAEQEGLNPTLLSRTVATLIGDGLISRTPDAGDRRSAWIEPTAEGRRVAERIRHERTQAVETALDGLDAEDRDAVLGALPALERLAEHLAEHGGRS